ncbi:MAG: hypothetical protein EA422_05435 [Gemmatimonadales bacterium]|nr:MAG: hypothetical protein EA422_05435 [Gemmatimonadales bacterium]
MSRVGAAILGLLAAFVFHAPPLVAQQAGPDGSRIVGTVVDAGSGEPIASATVLLAGTGVSRVTDAEGRFRFEGLAPGTYALSIRHVAYQERGVEVEVVGEGMLYELVVRLSVDAIPLDPIVVSGRRDGPLAGSRDRIEWMERVGLGTHFNRQAIEESRASRITHLLARVPGVQIRGGGQGAGGAGLFLNPQRNCQPSIYVDGIRSPLFGGSVDDMVSLNEVESVEVYRRLSELPGEFADDLARQCGAVVISTRRDVLDGEPFGWRRMATLVGFLTFSFFVGSAR